jgi:hypothetical protein
VTAPTLTGELATTTYLESSGAPNVYSLTASVLGSESVLPTGMVTFVDTSNGNAVLGTAALTTETGSGFAGSSLLSVASQESGKTILTADFNGDGIPDLVILGDGISVLLGNGDGTFTAAPRPPADLPGSVVVGDFNGDGAPDLAVAPRLDEGDSEVLLGKGDGTFNLVHEDFGNKNGIVTSSSIAVGDFNGDGKLDLAETCSSINEQPCNSLLILLGNGDGTFIQSSAIPFDIFGFQSTAAGDFNGDGHLDLAVTDSGSNDVTILLGSGDGSFTPTANLVTGVNPSSIAAADFNRDGRLDLAVTDSGSNDVTILLGNGDGNFTSAASAAAGIVPASVAIGDFNGDGATDLVVANAGSSRVTILSGNGDGTFTAAASPAADTGSTSVAVADFNADGKEDIVVANSAYSSATALLGETALAIAIVNNVSPAGVGTHLVKAIYSGDAHYAGRTSADAALTVVPPGFLLSSTPVVVTAGATGVSTLTVTPTNGFSGNVTLECSGSSRPGDTNINDVPTCLAIPLVTISGDVPATAQLRIQTQLGTTPAQYGEFVTATDSRGVAMDSTNISITVNAPVASFALTNTPVSIASPGASGTSTITVTPNGGFGSDVSLSCAVAGPADAVDVPSCSITAQVSITSTLPVTATLTVNTTAASAGSTPPSSYLSHRNPLRHIFPIGGATMAALLFLAPPVFRRRWNPWLGLLLFAVFAGGAIGCGAAMTKAPPVPPVTTNPGTIAGTYSVTVTGVSGNSMATTTVTVTVM